MSDHDEMKYEQEVNFFSTQDSQKRRLEKVHGGDNHQPLNMMTTSAEILKAEEIKKKKEQEILIKTAMEAAEAAMQQTINRINQTMTEVRGDLNAADGLKDQLDTQIFVLRQVSKALKSNDESLKNDVLIHQLGWEAESLEGLSIEQKDEILREAGQKHQAAAISLSDKIDAILDGVKPKLATIDNELDTLQKQYDEYAKLNPNADNIYETALSEKKTERDVLLKDTNERIEALATTKKELNEIDVIINQKEQSNDKTVEALDNINRNDAVDQLFKAEDGISDPFNTASSPFDTLEASITVNNDQSEELNSNEGKTPNPFETLPSAAPNPFG